MMEVSMSTLHRFTRLAVASSLALIAAPAAWAQKAPALKFGPAPAVFPRGATMAVVSGDPSKAGPFVVHLSMPSGYRIAPHFHPTDEHVTVRSGTLRVGMGDAIDLKAAKTLTAGQSVDMKANMHHFGVTKGHTVVEVSAQGPFAMTYVNAADDPRTKAVAKGKAKAKA